MQQWLASNSMEDQELRKDPLRSRKNQIQELIKQIEVSLDLIRMYMAKEDNQRDKQNFVTL